MEVRETSAIIRPEMHAPEVDEYDEIPLANIETKVDDIGQKVTYTL